MINTLSLLIISYLLVRHVIRLVRVWRASHTISVTSSLFIPAMVLLLVALFTEHDWASWVAAVFLLLIAIWKFKGPGAILDQCEDGLAESGISHAEMLEYSREQDELSDSEDSYWEREQQIEKDRKTWWKDFAVEARPKAVTTQIELPDIFPLRTIDDQPLAVGPGRVKVTFDAWQYLPVENENYEIGLRLRITDNSGGTWSTRYRTDIEKLADIGFSSEPRRKPEELVAWTQIDSIFEKAIRENCLVAKAAYQTDMRDRIDARIGKHRYLVVTKYQHGKIDLAWEPVSQKFLLRLAGLYYRERDGALLSDLNLSDRTPGPEFTPWDPSEIEPVVFPILPEELLPFGPKSLSCPFRFDYETETWPPLFSRENDPA